MSGTETSFDPTSPMSLRGRRILVTGASSGLGRATAVALAHLGARVVLVGRNAERLQATHDALAGDGHSVAPCDLTDVDGIKRWLTAVAADGKLHGLVHSAGIQLTAPLRIQSAAKVQEVLQINLLAAMELVRVFRTPKVRAKDGDSAVLVSSVMGRVGQAGVSAYSASKGALSAFCRSAALELAAEGVRLNTVVPAVVDTEMTDAFRAQLTEAQFQAIQDSHPLGLGRPEDVAHGVAFLLSPAARWITGTDLIIDGGYTAH